MNRTFALLLATAACGASPDPTSTPDAGSGSGSGSATCDPNVPHLSPGSTVAVSSAAAGNPQRDYCLVVPMGSTQIRLDLNGGTCGAFSCLGDDVRMYLERGVRPDAFDPDGSTTAWSYTPDPNGFGMYVKIAQPGVWYLALIDDANTLGYKNVTMKLTFP